MWIPAPKIQMKAEQGIWEKEIEGQVLCFFLSGEEEESLWDRWHFPWCVQDAWDLDIEEQKGRGFRCVNKSLEVRKQSWLEGKVCERWQLEARLEKLVVPGHEVLKYSDRWLDLLCSEEASKGACESPRITWL